MGKAESVGAVALDVVCGSTAPFQRAVRSAAKSSALSASNTFTSVFRKIGAVTATAFSVKAISAFGKECVNLASDLEEVQNVVDVTFGKSADTINEWSKTTSKAFGVSELSAKKYSGTIGAMLKSMGIASDNVLDMSMNITDLAGDMASFYNLDTDTAFDKIRAGISGETEPLKQLGINLSVANLEAFALSKGITTSYNKMSQADQAILRYNYLLTTTADAQGDFTRTSASWANQTRILALNMDTFKATCGELIKNGLTPLLVKLNSLIEYANSAAVAMAKLFGKDLTVKKSSSGMDGLSNSALSATSNLNDTAKTAAKTAKKIKASFADVDEIHVLGQKDDTSGSNSSAGVGGQTLSPLSAMNYEIKDSASELDTSQFEKKLGDIGNLTGAALMGLGVIVTLLGNPALGIGMIIAGTTIHAAALNWNSTGNKTKKVLNTIETAVSGALLAVGAILCLTGVSTPIGIALIAAGAVGLATSTALNWNGISEKTKTTLSVITAIASSALLALGVILCATSANIPLGVALIGAGALGLTSTVAANWGGMPQQVKNTLSIISAVASGALMAIGLVLALTSFNPALGLALVGAGAVGMVATTAVNWKKMPDSVKKTITAIGAVVGTALLAIGAIAAFSGVGIPLGIALMTAGAASLGTAVAVNWGWIKDKLKTVFSGVLSVVSASAIVLGALMLFNPATLPLGIGLIYAGSKGIAKAQAIDNNLVTRNIQKAWTGVKGVLNTVAGGVERFVNGIVGGINRMIDSINALKLTIPDWVPKYGGKELGFHLNHAKNVSIPRLWTGGYAQANNPQLAIVGDNQNEGEIISPESKIRENFKRAVSELGGVSLSDSALKQILREVLYEVLGQMSDSLGGRWVIQVIDKTGNVQIVDTIDAARRKNRRDGKTVVSVGV